MAAPMARVSTRRGTVLLGLLLPLAAVLLLRSGSTWVGAGTPALGMVTRSPAGDHGSLVARPAMESCTGEAMVDEAINADGVVVVSFSTTWCGPCKLMDPKVTELSETYESVRFIKVMGDKDPDGMVLMKRDGVRSVPQYHVYKDGVKVDQIAGAKYDELVQALQKHTS